MTGSIQEPTPRPQEQRLVPTQPVAEPSTLGRLVRHAASSEASIIAVPADLASLCLSTASAPLRAPVVKHIVDYSTKGVAGGMYLVASATHGVASAGNLVFKIAGNPELLQQLQTIAGLASTGRYEDAEKKRQEAGEMIQEGLTGLSWGATAMKWVKYVPGIGTGVMAVSDLVDAAASYGMSIEEGERKFSQQITFVGKNATPALITITGLAVRALLLIPQYAAKTTLVGSSWLQNKSITVWQNPSILSDSLLEAERRTDVCSFKIQHYFDEQIIDRESQIKEQPSVGAEYIKEYAKQVKDEQLTKFCSSLLPYRNEMFAVTKHYAQKLSINEAQLQAYESVLTNVRDCRNNPQKIQTLLQDPAKRPLLQELVALFAYLEGGIGTFLSPLQEKPAPPIHVAALNETHLSQISDTDIQLFASLPPHDKEDVLSKIEASNKIFLTDQEKRLYRKAIKEPLGEETKKSYKELVFLFKTLDFDQKKSLFPSEIQVIATIQRTQAGKHVTDSEMDAFLQKTTQKERKDILYLIRHSKVVTINRDTYEEYADVLKKLETVSSSALSDDEKTALKEIIGIFNLLPGEERKKLTPSLFENFDELVKLQVIDILREYAKNLSDEERSSLYPKTKLLHRGDWAKLTEPERKNLIAVVAEKWNELPTSIQQKISSLSYQQYQELSDNEKKHFLHAICTKTDLPQEDAKIIQELRGKEPTELSKQQIDCLLEIFDKNFSRDEKIAVYNMMKAEIALFAYSYEEIRSLIDELKQKRADPHVQRLIDCLEAQLKDIQEAKATGRETSLRPAERIDMPHLRSLVGPTVSSGRTRDFFNATGVSLQYATGSVGTHFCNTMAWVSNPQLIETLMWGSAHLIQLGLSFQCVQESTMRALSHVPGTIPLERVLQNMPFYILGGFKKFFEMAHLHTEHIQKTIVFIRENQKLLEEAVPGFANLTAAERTERVNAYIADLMHQEKEIIEKAEPLQKLLTETVDAICRKDQKALMCTDEVFTYLKDSTTWEQLASKYGVDRYSLGFLKLLRHMTTRGELPNPQTFSQGLEATEKIATTQALDFIEKVEPKSHISDFISWLSKKPIIGRGAHYAQAGIELVGEPLAARATSAMTTASALYTVTSETLATGWRYAWGAEQALSPEMNTFFQDLTVHYGALQALEAKGDSVNTAIASLDAIKNTYYGACLMTLSKYVPVGTESASLDLTKNCLKIAGKLSGGFLELVNAQMSLKTDDEIRKALESSVEADMHSLMLTGATKALAAFSSPSKLKEYGRAAIQLPGLIGGVWGLCKVLGGTTFITIALIQKLLPPLLFVYSKQSSRVRPFWQGLAQSAQELAVSKTPPRFMQAAAAGSQAIVDTVSRKAGIIDPLAVEQFLNDLSEKEKMHMLELAYTRANTDEQKLLEPYVKLEKKLDNSQQDAKVIAELILKLYPFSVEDDLLQTPTSFDNLPPEMQQKITTLVEKKCGLTPQEALSTKTIVEKFNTLPEDVRKTIHAVTIEEYCEASIEERETTRLKLANAQVRRELGLIGKTFTSDATIVKRTLSVFNELSKMNNSELRPLLESFHTLPQESHQILTPHQYFSMNEGRRRHLLEIVKRHPGLLDALCQKESQDGGPRKIDPVYNVRRLEELIGRSNLSPLEQKEQEQLVVVLCCIFNSLENYEKVKLLYLTEAEFRLFSAEEQAKVLTFLIGQHSLQDSSVELNKELLKLTEKKPINISFIISCFNAVPPNYIAEFRDIQEIGKLITPRLKEVVQRELNKSALRINGFHIEIAKEEKKLLALNLKIENATRDLSTAQDEPARSTKQKEIDEYIRQRDQVTKGLAYLEMKREQEIDEYERLQQILTGKNIFDAIDNECLVAITPQDKKMFKASHELVAKDTLLLVSSANVTVLHDYRAQSGYRREEFDAKVDTFREQRTKMQLLAQKKIDASKSICEKRTAEVRGLRKSVRQLQDITAIIALQSQKKTITPEQIENAKQAKEQLYETSKKRLEGCKEELEAITKKLSSSTDADIPALQRRKMYLEKRKEQLIKLSLSVQDWPIKDISCLEQEIAELQEENTRKQMDIKILTLYWIPLYEIQLKSTNDGVSKFENAVMIIRDRGPFTKNDPQFEEAKKDVEEAKKKLEDAKKLFDEEVKKYPENDPRVEAAKQQFEKTKKEIESNSKFLEAKTLLEISEILFPSAPVAPA